MNREPIFVAALLGALLPALPAQEDGAQPMPQKEHELLRQMVGTWQCSGTTAATAPVSSGLPAGARLPTSSGLPGGTAGRASSGFCPTAAGTAIPSVAAMQAENKRARMDVTSRRRRGSPAYCSSGLRGAGPPARLSA